MLTYDDYLMPVSLGEALRYAKDRVEDAIKVVVKNEHAAAVQAIAAE